MLPEYQVNFKYFQPDHRSSIECPDREALFSMKSPSLKWADQFRAVLSAVKPCPKTALTFRAACVALQPRLKRQGDVGDVHFVDLKLRQPLCKKNLRSENRNSIVIQKK